MPITQFASEFGKDLKHLRKQNKKQWHVLMKSLQIWIDSESYFYLQGLKSHF